MKNVQRTVLMMGKIVEQVQSIPCGNTSAGLFGLFFNIVFALC